LDTPIAYVVLDDNEEDPMRNCRYQERKIRLAPTESNKDIWKGVCRAYRDVYEGGIFEVEIVPPADYLYVASLFLNYCPLTVF